MKKTIGTVNGKPVLYAEATATMWIYGTSICIANIHNEDEAIAAARRNFRGFKTK